MKLHIQKNNVKEPQKTICWADYRDLEGWAEFCLALPELGVKQQIRKNVSFIKQRDGRQFSCYQALFTQAGQMKLQVPSFEEISLEKNRVSGSFCCFSSLFTLPATGLQKKSLISKTTNGGLLLTALWMTLSSKAYHITPFSFIFKVSVTTSAP